MCPSFARKRYNFLIAYNIPPDRGTLGTPVAHHTSGHTIAPAVYSLLLCNNFFVSNKKFPWHPVPPKYFVHFLFVFGYAKPAPANILLNLLFYYFRDTLVLSVCNSQILFSGSLLFLQAYKLCAGKKILSHSYCDKNTLPTN